MVILLVLFLLHAGLAVGFKVCPQWSLLVCVGLCWSVLSSQFITLVVLWYVWFISWCVLVWYCITLVSLKYFNFSGFSKERENLATP